MDEIDRGVIDRAISGDMEAFKRLYAAYSGMAYTVAFRITGNHADAQDATQEVFVKMHRSLGEFRLDSSLKTWIYRVAVNTAINIYRSRKRRRTEPIDENDINEIGIAPEAGRLLEKMEAEEMVKDLLSCLTPEHRACIVLREIEGLDYKEIAGALGIPLNTVRTRLLRAREALIEHCKKGEDDHEL